MKKLAVLTSLLLASAAFAQGTINFQNRVTSVTPPINAPVSGADGNKVSGTDYLAQLYVGTSAGSLSAVGVALPFRTGALAGYVVGGVDASVTVPTIAGGANAFVQMKAWEAAKGGNYEAAVAAGGKFGVSNTIQITLGGAGSPPSLPANLTGLEAFSLVPEPSTIALGVLGAASLVLIRRRK